MNSSRSTSSEDTDEDWYVGSIEVEDDNKNNDKPVPELIEESDNDQDDDNDSDDEIVDELWVNAIETDCKDWNTILCLKKTEVEFKLDTGSQANILTKTEFLKVKNHGKIHPTNAKLIAYDGSRINVVGKCVLHVSRGKKSFPTEFMVVDTKSPCIIGLRSCESLNLVKRVYVGNDEIEPDILNDYPDTW